MARVRVAVQASDLIARSGVESLLRTRAELTLLTTDLIAEADVIVLVADKVTVELMETLRQLAALGSARCVLITDELPRAYLMTAVECRVFSTASRQSLCGDRLLRAVLGAARGQGQLPPDVQGALLLEVGRLQHEILAPKKLTASGLTARELEVLSLLAEGWESKEIAKKLCYSERTVKNVLHGVLSRLKLHNRAHAVAYALRSGLI